MRALTAGLHHAEMNTAAARAAASLTKKHHYRLADERHRPNVQLNFWEDAGDAVSYRVLTDGVEVTVDKAGVAQRFYGGEVEAVNYSHLWIPVDPESEGKSAGEFDDLYPVISPLTGKGVGIRKSDKKVLFALVESITQDEDPSVMPTSDEYEAEVAAAFDVYVDRRLRQTVETAWAGRGD